MAAVTAVCYRADLNFASTTLVYLVAIVLHSLDCAFWQSAALSIVSVVCLDYFFITPRFTFYVTRPSDGVTLACFLSITLVTTELQRRLRAQAASAGLQRENMGRIYNISQSLLGLDLRAAIEEPMLQSIVAEFQLNAACIFDGVTAEIHSIGESRDDLASKTRDAYIAGSDISDPALDITVRVFRSTGTVAGAIGFAGLRDAPVIASAIAALAATAIQRTRAFRAASESAAQASAETLRSVILDALAHEVKTPLAAILAAAGGIRATGSVQPQQAELADLIETEAARLADLTSRLLRTARLDREEIKPRLERISVAELAEKAVRRYAKLWVDHRMMLVNHSDGAEVRADPELILLALSQLLENACRYSLPDEGIAVQLSADATSAAITVVNRGSPIPAFEHDRIFERFYRGDEARKNSPGTGLGLYVARKIAVAHGGSIEVVDAGEHSAAVRLTLPVAASEASDG